MINTRYFSLIAAILLLLTITAYENSFHNSFHFDDFHTIVNNLFVRDISNIPLYFRDGSTFSSLPLNQSYRPIVTATLAIDYWLGNGLADTFYFHLSMFIMFIFQGILMYFLYLKVFDLSDRKDINALIALIAVGSYLLHPANAETINYIISRSDSYSAVFIVMALVLYSRSIFCRKWHLYLVPAALGILTKPIAGVFPLLLLVYLYLFEESASLTDLIKREGFDRFSSSARKAAPAFLFVIGMLIFVKKMDPPTWTPGGVSKFQYLITQPYVVLKYFLTFFLPVSLSADTDLLPFSSIAELRCIIGFIFVVVLLSIAIITSKYEKLRPVSFGILWFFITLIPTSIIPLAEVMNDHRIFFPYVGLMMSVSWSLSLLLLRFRQQITSPLFYRALVAGVIALVLAISCYGTHRRNAVWKSEETLWRDVTEKSPNNGRGMMNYGVVLMAKADYGGAEKYFMKALELSPSYGTLYTNLGVLSEASGNTVQAEEYFRKAITLQPQIPDPYFYYARFLKNRERNAEAIVNLEKSLQLSTAYLNSRYLLMDIYINLADFGKVVEIAEQTLRLVPGDKRASMYLDAVKSGKSKTEIIAAVESPPGTPEYYLNLSLGYYREGAFDKCIAAAQQALKLRPNYDLAYNNICSANIELKKWEKAIEAGETALKINPGNVLARNNLARAKELGRMSSRSGLISSNDKTAEELLNLSLIYYQKKEYYKSIDSAQRALIKKPDYDLAYNNVCAAYNALQQWDRAIEACRQAVQLNPANKLARNNLDWAQNLKATYEKSGKIDSR